MEIGKYDTGKFVMYLRENPQFMDRILTLYGRFDLPGLRELLGKLDFSSPLPPQPLTHKNYIDNQAEIHRLIMETNAYPEKVENKDYLQDEYIKELYSQSAGMYDAIWGGEWVYEARRETMDALEAKLGERILEVAVGSGINLSYFTDGCEIVGVDYCEAMLQKAIERARELPGRRISP